MNEHTIELYKQAVAFAYNTAGADAGKGTVIDSLTAGKFAELIVRECLKFVEPDQTSGDEWCVTLDETAQSIKQHFGIEQ